MGNSVKLSAVKTLIENFRLHYLDWNLLDSQDLITTIFLLYFLDRNYISRELHWFETSFFSQWKEQDVTNRNEDDGCPHGLTVDLGSGSPLRSTASAK